MGKSVFWGYKHINGELKTKAYFDERDLAVAHESEFVDIVYDSFTADNVLEASLKLQRMDTKRMRKERDSITPRKRLKLSFLGN